MINILPSDFSIGANIDNINTIHFVLKMLDGLGDAPTGDQSFTEAHFVGDKKAVTIAVDSTLPPIQAQEGWRDPDWDCGELDPTAQSVLRT